MVATAPSPAGLETEPAEEPAGPPIGSAVYAPAHHAFTKGAGSPGGGLGVPQVTGGPVELRTEGSAARHRYGAWQADVTVMPTGSAGGEMP